MKGVGGLGALAWVAFKVGALSYGGGFVIIPLMQHDAVSTYHWMTGAQFLNAVALGQVTPGPVVQTVAVVGYAAGGVGGGLLGALVAFAPSFAFVLFGGQHFAQIRANRAVGSFLTGTGPAVIGAIAGSALPLGLSFGHLWQVPVLAGALAWLFVVHRGVVSALLIAGAAGAVVALAGVAV
jgi:chromate transporter